MEKPPAFYAALAASAVSTAGWLLAVVGSGYLFYVMITGGERFFVGWLVILGILLGPGFAIIERRLYRAD